VHAASKFPSDGADRRPPTIVSELGGINHLCFRALQGLGAGGLTALAIIGDLVPPRDRGRYQGDDAGRGAGQPRIGIPNTAHELRVWGNRGKLSYSLPRNA
jgi:hypothetical protein